MNEIPARLAQLRERMTALGLTHYLIPSSDEHLNEYLPKRNQRREWASGFTGSAGDLLVGIDPAETLLFTDGRYHLQAQRQLDGSGIALQRVGNPGVKRLTEVLSEIGRRSGGKPALGFDGRVLSFAAHEAIAKAAPHLLLPRSKAPSNLVDELWTDRPGEPSSALEEVPLDLAGEGFAAKVARVRERLAQEGADAHVVVKLDQIAWLTNLRSLDDVPYNPVFLAFLWLDAARVVLFLHGGAKRLPRGFGGDVAGFEAREYASFSAFVAGCEAKQVLLDQERTTFDVAYRLRTSEGRRPWKDAISPLERFKSVKNDAELRAMERANLHASAAKSRAIVWLDQALARGETVTERRFLERIESLYAKVDGYRALSFNTISAAGDHAALPHYADADGTLLRDGDTFVIDSGIQTTGGTTDDTRTVGVGNPTPERRRIFTLVLKAHIRGALATFPEGTTGTAIDAITREPLWAESLDYSHGTGHGVGAFLNVHEGPFTIGDSSRRPMSAYPLEPGMITSIEPGYYRIGLGGVRHENLYVVVERGRDAADRRWFGFRPITFIPFDLRWLDRSLLDARESAWLDQYHKDCGERLRPLLDAEENAALARALGSA